MILHFQPSIHTFLTVRVNSFFLLEPGFIRQNFISKRTNHPILHSFYTRNRYIDDQQTGNDLLTHIPPHRFHFGQSLLEKTKLFPLLKPDNDESYESSYFEITTCLPVKNTHYETFMLNIWFWLDIFLYSVFPFVSMGLCSAIIIFKINKINKNYFKHLCSREASSSKDSSNKVLYLKKLKKNFQICVMLISSSCYFLFTMVVFWVWYLLKYEKSESFYRNLTQSYVYVLLYTNNAFGFIFYGISSTKYRREFLRTFVRPRIIYRV